MGVVFNYPLFKTYNKYKILLPVSAWRVVNTKEEFSSLRDIILINQLAQMVSSVYPRYPDPLPDTDLVTRPVPVTRAGQLVTSYVTSYA